MDIGNFPERLRKTIGETSVRGFAALAGLSEGALRKYLRNESYPTLDRLATIAWAGGVCMPWLVTGRGPMRAEPESVADAGPPATARDQRSLADTLERALAEIGLAITAPGESDGGLRELWSNNEIRCYLLCLKPIE